MEILIRECQSDDLDALQELTVLAFEPIFESFAKILGAEIYKSVYPDWKTLQKNLVLSLYNNEKMNVWIAAVDNEPVTRRRQNRRDRVFSSQSQSSKLWDRDTPE